MLLQMAILFFIIAEWYHIVYVYIYHNLFIHLSAIEHLGCFHVLAIVLINSAVINIGVYASFWIRVFIYSRYMNNSGIARSYGRFIFSL